MDEVGRVHSKLEVFCGPGGKTLFLELDGG